VLDGALGHKDSMGTSSSIVPGDVQRMSAGTGVQHSEFNYSETGTTHFLQIWIIPSAVGVTPSYAQKHFPAEEKRGRLRLVISPDGAEDSVVIHQDARMYAGLFDGDEAAELALAPGRLGYVHVARGEVVRRCRERHAGELCHGAMSHGAGPVECDDRKRSVEDRGDPSTPAVGRFAGREGVEIVGEHVEPVLMMFDTIQQRTKLAFA
jgi:redox-sensitive bicupin YhaK (pirin superfamily)